MNAVFIRHMAVNAKAVAVFILRHLRIARGRQIAFRFVDFIYIRRSRWHRAVSAKALIYNNM